MKRRFLPALGLPFILTLTLTLASCANQNMTNADGSTDTSKKTQSSGMNPASENQDATSDGKTLVVYFSATGNTKEAAAYIASATNGDLFELEPVIPYSNSDLDWTDDDSRVVKEHNNPDERNVGLVSATADNWDEYDTIFIGYPIWWGIAAWPVNGFMDANDFTGKTVIPFCTSSSSGLGESGRLLEETAGAGNWLEGKRFSSNVSETEVVEWIESLRL